MSNLDPKIISSIQFKRGLKSALEKHLKGDNRPLYGEPCYELDTNKIKIGDGIHDYVDLPYLSEQDISNFVLREINGSNGKSLIFNEADGGGAKFEGKNGVNSYVGTHDNIGGEVGAQIYVDKANGNESTIIDVTQNGAYYTKGTIKPGSERDIPENEIAVKGDFENYYTIPEIDEISANKLETYEVTVNGAAGKYVGEANVPVYFELTSDGENVSVNAYNVTLNTTKEQVATVSSMSIPNASNLNTGLLSKSDYEKFDSKVDDFEIIDGNVEWTD